MAPITINENTIDLVAPGEHKFPADASKHDYVLLQGDGRFDNHQRDILEGLEIELQEYLGDGAYLCIYKPHDLSRIQALPFVNHAVIYHPTFKIHPRTKVAFRAAIASSTSDNDQPQSDSLAITHSVIVVVHNDDHTSVDHVVSLIQARTKAKIDYASKPFIHVQCNETDLTTIGEIDGVRAIDEHPQRKALDIYARQVLKADYDTMAPPLNTTPYLGKDQLIGVFDTGFDEGSTTNVHPAFQPNRILQVAATSMHIPDGTIETTPKEADGFGHGTNVASCALANGLYRPMNGADPLPEEPVKGSAPSASLISVKISPDAKNGTMYPIDLINTFRSFHDTHDLFIMNNSWGPPFSTTLGQQPYSDTTSKAIDDHLFSSLYNDSLIIFAAGNDGNLSRSIPAEIDAEAGAKNTLTVGACTTARPLTDLKRRWVPERRAELVPLPTNHVCGFSSRGPTREGRVKPDVVAPGTGILMAKSRHNPDDVSLGDPADPYYLVNEGSSFAAPFVAGVAAALREALVRNKCPYEPIPGILLKALIIGGARDLQGGTAGTDPKNDNMMRGRGERLPPLRNPRFVTAIGPAPNGLQGYGSVSLEDSLKSVVKGSREGGYRVMTVEARGEDFGEVEVEVTQPSCTLSATMVWYDKGGRDMQDVIVLEVTPAGGVAMQVGAPLVDSPVQKVVIRNVAVGRVKIAARIAHILFYPQSVAIVWSLQGPQP